MLEGHGFRLATDGGGEQYYVDRSNKHVIWLYPDGSWKTNYFGTDPPIECDSLKEYLDRLAPSQRVSEGGAGSGR
jgi:hypothetical protein